MRKLMRKGGVFFFVVDVRTYTDFVILPSIGLLQYSGTELLIAMSD